MPILVSDPWGLSTLTLTKATESPLTFRWPLSQKKNFSRVLIKTQATRHCYVIDAAKFHYACFLRSEEQRATLCCGFICVFVFSSDLRVPPLLVPSFWFMDDANKTVFWEILERKHLPQPSPTFIMPKASWLFSTSVLQFFSSLLFAIHYCQIAKCALAIEHNVKRNFHTIAILTIFWNGRPVFWCGLKSGSLSAAFSNIRTNYQNVSKYESNGKGCWLYTWRVDKLYFFIISFHIVPQIVASVHHSSASRSGREGKKSVTNIFRLKGSSCYIYLSTRGIIKLRCFLNRPRDLAADLCTFPMRIMSSECFKSLDYKLRSSTHPRSVHPTSTSSLRSWSRISPGVFAGLPVCLPLFRLFNDVITLVNLPTLRLHKCSCVGLGVRAILVVALLSWEERSLCVTLSFYQDVTFI